MEVKPGWYANDEEKDSSEELCAKVAMAGPGYIDW